MSFCATVFWNWPKKLYPVTRFDRSNGRFQTDFVFGDILLAKKWCIFDNFQGLFLGLGSLSKSRVGGFTVKSWPKKHHPFYSKSMLKSLKILKMTFVKTMCCSFVKRVFNSDGRVLQEDKVGCNPVTSDQRRIPLKMCRKSGLEFLQRKTLCIDFIVVYAVIHPCML